MKYPITPEYLTGAPDLIVELFTDLEETILVDICRRFRVSGEATESAIAQMKVLQERGVNLDDIEKAIKKTLKLSEKELDEIISRIASDLDRDYAGEDDDEICRAWVEYTDKICESLSPERRAACMQIFRDCSRHELNFWKMSERPRADI